jgi:hypothetical protein
MLTSRFTTIGLTLLWSLAIAAGFYALVRYQFAPGVSANAPLQWPSQSQVSLHAQRSTLLMLLHPRCPCSRASVAELSQLMSHESTKLKAYVMFVRPKNAGENWEKTDLWSSAAAIPGVTVIPDIDGKEAERFKSQTSGQTLVYDADGRLLFTGGITAARGHIGDNQGLEKVKAILTKKPEQPASTVVFGCSLITPNCKKE